MNSTLFKVLVSSLVVLATAFATFHSKSLVISQAMETFEVCQEPEGPQELACEAPSRQPTYLPVIFPIALAPVAPSVRQPPIYLRESALLL